MAYEHITHMENILNQQKETLSNLEQQLNFVDEHRSDYRALLDYYYSEQRQQDLQDDEAGRIPSDLRRGVLSEDEIYDLLGDYRDTALRMMEIALHMLRED